MSLSPSPLFNFKTQAITPSALLEIQPYQQGVGSQVDRNLGRIALRTSGDESELPIHNSSYEPNVSERFQAQVRFEEFISAWESKFRKTEFPKPSEPLRDHFLKMEKELRQDPWFVQLSQHHSAQGYDFGSWPHKILLTSAQEGASSENADLLIHRQFLLDGLALMAMRIWDAGPEHSAANAQQIERLLDLLRIDGRLPILAVTHPSDLYTVATSIISQNEKEQVALQERLIKLYSLEHSRRFLHHQARHLRSISQSARNLHSEDRLRRARDVWRHRAANSVDYLTVILNLIPLLEEFEKNPTDPDIAFDILDALSGDPEMFLVSQVLEKFTLDLAREVFSHSHEVVQKSIFRAGRIFPIDLGEDRLKHYFGLLDRLRLHLHRHAERYRESGGFSSDHYTPFGRSDIYPIDVAGALALLQFRHPNAPHPLDFDTLGRPSDSESVARQNELLDQMFMGIKTPGSAIRNYHAEEGWLAFELTSYFLDLSASLTLPDTRGRPPKVLDASA